jgi:hypothetical protein
VLGVVCNSQGFSAKNARAGLKSLSPACRRIGAEPAHGIGRGRVLAKAMTGQKAEERASDRQGAIHHW